MKDKIRLYVCLAFIIGLGLGAVIMKYTSTSGDGLNDCVGWVDTAPDNPHVENRWDCEEGCIYAEWITYGYKNLTFASPLYNKCTQMCWKGDSSFIDIIQER